MSAGFVYVLVNSSMPGLVKIGKTTRDPADRAEELSRVTGVATPFVMIFKQYFQDCDAAETQIHRALDHTGQRISNVREFFRVPPDQAIRVILAAAGGWDGVSAEEELDKPSVRWNYDVNTGFRAEEDVTAQPWQALIAEADDLRYGLGSEIEDPVNALSIYKAAIHLGALVGYERIGFMYHMGIGVPANLDKALDCYRTGTEKGNYYCWAGMAAVFHNKDQDDNASKCWVRFFDNRQRKIDPDLEEPGKLMRVLEDCCIYCMLDNKHGEILHRLRQFKSDILIHCKLVMVAQEKAGTPRPMIDWNAGIQRWSETL